MDFQGHPTICHKNKSPFCLIFVLWQNKRTNIELCMYFFFPNGFSRISGIFYYITFIWHSLWYSICFEFCTIRRATTLAHAVRFYHQSQEFPANVTHISHILSASELLFFYLWIRYMQTHILMHFFLLLKFYYTQTKLFTLLFWKQFCGNLYLNIKDQYYFSLISVSIWKKISVFHWESKIYQMQDIYANIYICKHCSTCST